MATGFKYCHPYDVSLSIRGEFDRVDSLGKLVKIGQVNREIMSQSGVIRAALRTEFPTLNNHSFWNTYPIEHPNNASDGSLLNAAIEDSLGMDEISLIFTSASEYKIVTPVLGTVTEGQTYTEDFSGSGITIAGSNWQGTPANGDIYYIGCYNVDPVIVAICAKLTMLQLVTELLQKQALEVEPKLVSNAVKLWNQRLADIRDHKMDLGGRNYVEVGQVLNLPQWTIDDLGNDASLYRKVNDTGSGGLGE